MLLGFIVGLVVGCILGAIGMGLLCAFGEDDREEVIRPVPGATSHRPMVLIKPKRNR